MPDAQVAPSRGNARPLGIRGEPIHTPPVTEGSKTRTRTPLEVRRHRHDLRRTAQKLLYVKGADQAEQHATCWCGRTVRSRAEHVYVYRRIDGQDARISGLISCGLIWTCPMCAGKVAEARREELSQAMVKAHALGYHAYLLTKTFPHGADDRLEELLERQAKAEQHFKNGRGYKRIKATHGRLGSVRALECTWGLNGWHPHTHELIFARPGLLEDLELRRRLKRAWLRACLRNGLVKPDGTLKPFRDFWRHALDLRGGDRAAEYVAKYGRDERWGLSSELTSARAKVGIRRAAWSEDLHFTPFQLLEWAAGGDGAARAMFREYAAAFKGKRALTWTPGLKKAIDQAELDDAELAAEERPMPEEERVGMLTADEFAQVVERNAVPELLEYAATCCNADTGQRDLQEWLAWLIQRPPSHAAAIRIRRFIGSGYITRYDDGQHAAPAHA